MIDRAAIAAARRQLATQPDFLRTTPLMRLSGKSLGVDCAEVWLKLEHLQVGGSFKARGMLYRLLANPVPESGVIIASGLYTLLREQRLRRAAIEAANEPHAASTRLRS